jgi:hypothetical protein
MPWSLIAFFTKFLTPQKGENMSKEQVLADAKVAFAQKQDEVLSQVLGDVFDKAQAEVPPSQGGFSQADIDKAVADAVAALQAKDDADVKALADAHAEADAAIADLKGQLDAAVKSKQAEDSVVQGLQAKADEIQKLIDALRGLVMPAPAQP